MSIKIYDYIICGAGASGLILASSMLDDKYFSNKKILLIEKENKNLNDRTWSFWEGKNGKFDDLTDACEFFGFVAEDKKGSLEIPSELSKNVDRLIKERNIARVSKNFSLADKIREEISLFSGKTITENLVFQTKNQIRGYFRDKSFYNVSVQIDRITDTVINNS